MNAPLAAVLICLASQAAAATPCERAAYEVEPPPPQMVMTSASMTQNASLIGAAHAQERPSMRADATGHFGAQARTLYGNSMAAAPHQVARQRSFNRQPAEESGGSDVRLLVVGLALMAGIALRRLGSGPR